jgi:uncharacterized protein (TIGR02099 family)
LKDYFLDKLTTWLWSSIVIFIVVLAVYASFGRLVTTNLAQYREALLRELNARIDFVVEVDGLQGGWSTFTPRIEMQGVRVMGDAHAPIAVEIASLHAEVDVLQSLLTGTVQFFQLTASKASVHVDVGAEGELQLPGLPVLAGGSSFGNPLYDFVQNAEKLQFEELTISIHQDAELRQLHVNASLLRDEEFRRFKMSLLSPSREAWVRVIAEGTGSFTDIANFNGLFHLETSLGDIANYNNWLQPFNVSASQGRFATELWLDFSGGDISVAARIDSDELQLQLPGDDFPLMELARLGGIFGAQYRQGIWNFGLSELTLVGAEQELKIAHLQGDYDGAKMTLLSRDLELEPIVDFLSQGNFLPTDVHGVLADLSPRGHVDSVRLELKRIGESLRWQVQSNFAGLGVDSFKGAPGVTNASGYLAMDAGAGRVQVESTDFSMFFPTVYRDPLEYSTFKADLLWQLDEEAFYISSGPFRGEGEDGESRGLFALNFPRQKTEVGAEMELVVGVAQTRALKKAKYLPFTLSQNLLSWLDASIVEGVFREGGFIWRGSLKNKSHRTVQLFLDVLDTELDYHADWPALTGVNGLILIDDTDVDAYVDSATLLDSQLRDTQVELRTNSQKQLIVNIEGHLQGDAQDGLTVVNTSPLQKMVGNTFADWQLAGPLQTDLLLELNLTDITQPPVVQVETVWDGVRVDAGSINLTIEDVRGVLGFNSDSGFSATGITASMWGESLLADVSQGRDGDQLAELDIAARGRVRSAAVKDWLQLDVLRLAKGEAELAAHIKVPSGGGARLELSSDLQGVSLDLPEPWGKVAAASKTMHLQVPLSSGPRRVLVDLEREVYLGVLIDEGYSGGSLGFGAPLAAEQAGRFLIGGKLDKLDWAQWSACLDEYILPAGEGVPALGLLLGVRELQVTVLEAFGRRFEQLDINADQSADQWQVFVNTSWLAGGVALPVDLASMEIKLDWLDIGKLSEGFTERLGSVDAGEFSLPPTTVAIAELRDNENLWGNVNFELEDQGNNYHFTNIRGQLRGLQLGDEEGLTLDWLEEEGGAETHLSGRLGFVDFGEVLLQYNYDQVVQTEQGHVDIDLRWPGSPADFELAQSTGHMDIDVGQGSFLKTSGAAEGTLRVVGILNLADFVSRLSLDISYMFQSGIPFDKIEGQLQMGEGTIEVPSMQIAGPSSRFEFVGSADVKAETVDGQLVATLPIASNLPWIAALISGLPAAVAVYVVSKLFTKQMDRFSSAIYQVEGPWNEPEVTFEKIFDNTAETVQSSKEQANTAELSAEASGN